VDNSWFVPELSTPLLLDKTSDQLHAVFSFFDSGQIFSGRVCCSSCVNQIKAWTLESPHMTADGLRRVHTAGRCGWPKIRQRLAVSSCAQRIPAGLPCGMPGMGLEMEGAMQQAPQPDRHSMGMICSGKEGT
jgi:hypothetical protein